MSPRWASYRFRGRTAPGLPYSSRRVCRSPAKSGTSIWSNSLTSSMPTVAEYGARPSIFTSPARPLVTRTFQWVNRAPNKGPALASPPWRPLLLRVMSVRTLAKGRPRWLSKVPIRMSPRDQTLYDDSPSTLMPCSWVPAGAGLVRSSIVKSSTRLSCEPSRQK